MASIRVSFNIRKAKAKLKKKEAFIQRELRAGQREVAEITLASLKADTPKKTGKTRKAWRMEPARGAGGRFGFGYTIENNEPTMIWLEDGTRAHGPVKAKRLYIPQTLAARKGYKKGMKFGRDYILAKKVRGIKPHNIVRNQLGLTKGMLLNNYNKVMRRAKRI